MQVIRNLCNINESHRNVVVTIGNFDGLHLGHRELLSTLKHEAVKLGCRTMAIIFEPQPNEFLRPDNQIPRLMTLAEKISGFRKQGIDYLLCLPFNRSISTLSAEEFVVDLLVNRLAIKYILVGDDFRFGYQRTGNFKQLQTFGERYNFCVGEMPVYEIDGERVSSTKVRQLLNDGDMAGVQKLLGHPFELQGSVVHGDKRGRLLGFPTANIPLRRKKIPLSGVFAVKVLGVAGRALFGAANVGVRPTISGKTKALLEVHLFDFAEDIYGAKVRVLFLVKLRDEQKFASLDLLKEQISCDVLQAKAFCSNLD